MLSRGAWVTCQGFCSQEALGGRCAPHPSAAGAWLQGGKPGQKLEVQVVIKTARSGPQCQCGGHWVGTGLPSHVSQHSVRDREATEKVRRDV